MATDYQINLAKSFTSSPEQRRKFYNGMLIYLALCAVAMICTAYVAAVSLLDAHSMNRQRDSLVETVNSVSDFSKTFYKDPEDAYRKLELYIADLAILRDVLGQRSHFLPVMSHMFADFPEDVALISLTASADRKTLSFGLVVPLSDQERGDPVRKLQSVWNNNEELMQRVRSIRPVTGERRMVDDQAAFFVQFDCFLK